MAANQAAEMCDKDIRVVPTKTIPQGITCITMFNGEDDIDTNMENLNSVMEVVKTASVTYAVRDTEMDGKQIKEGDILGLIEGKISEVGNDVCVVASIDAEPTVTQVGHCFTWPIGGFTTIPHVGCGRLPVFRVFVIHDCGICLTDG